MDTRLDGGQVGSRIFVPAGVQLRKVICGEGVGASFGGGIVWKFQGNHRRAQPAGETQPVSAPLTEGSGTETLRINWLADLPGGDPDAVRGPLLGGHGVPHFVGQAGALRTVGVYLSQRPVETDDFRRLEGQNEIANHLTLWF